MTTTAQRKSGLPSGYAEVARLHSENKELRRQLGEMHRESSKWRMNYFSLRTKLDRLQK